TIHGGAPRAGSDRALRRPSASQGALSLRTRLSLTALTREHVAVLAQFNPRPSNGNGVRALEPRERSIERFARQAKLVGDACPCPIELQARWASSGMQPDPRQ